MFSVFLAHYIRPRWYGPWVLYKLKIVNHKMFEPNNLWQIVTDFFKLHLDLEHWNVLVFTTSVALAYFFSSILKPLTEYFQAKLFWVQSKKLIMTLLANYIINYLCNPWILLVKFSICYYRMLFPLSTFKTAFRFGLCGICGFRIHTSIGVGLALEWRGL